MYKFELGTLEGRNHVGDLGLTGMLMQMVMMRIREDVGVWTGSNLLCINLAIICCYII